MAIHKKTFTIADLNGEYALEYAHGLNNEDIFPTWIDEYGIVRGTADLFQVVDANTVILRCNNPVEGTQTLLLKYEQAGTTSSRHLFGLESDNNPDLDKRIVVGGPQASMVNIKLSAFLTWLMRKLGFLKAANNLSDLKDKATGRGFLGVYSMNEVRTLIDTKATLYQAASGGVLGTENTKKYNPFSNYNPVTLKDVQNNGMRMLLTGTMSASELYTEVFKNSDVLEAPINTVRIGTGVYRITHALGNINYHVLGTTIGTHSAHITCVDIKPNYFDIRIWDDNSLDDQDFEFFMFDFFTYTPN